MSKIPSPKNKGKGKKILLTSKQQKVHFVIDHKFFDIRISNDDVDIATVFLAFGLDVTEGSGD